MPCPLAEAIDAQRVWTNKAQFVDAERRQYTKLQNDVESSVKHEEVQSNPNAEHSKKPNNKKGKKSGVEHEPSKAIDTPNQSTADKKQKNEKNSKKQQQQQLAEKLPIATSTNDENANDDSKQNPSKAKKQKNKKENKKSAKKQQQEHDTSNKSNASSVSDDNHLLQSDKCDASKIKSKPDIVKSTKDKVNAKNLVIDESINKKVHVTGDAEECTLVTEIAKVRQHLKNSLERMDDIAALAGPDVLDRISTLEKENASLRQLVEELKTMQLQSVDRIKSLENRLGSVNLSSTTTTAAKSAAKPPADDDDVDLFGSESEEEDDAAAQLREKRLAEYAAKKGKKPALIAKSNVILDVKPWDDETDMKEMERLVRKIECDGLLWGTSKLVPLAFGIHKLTVSCVVEDEKVSIDWLTEEIEKNDELVQSVDVAAFNKI